MRAYLSRGDLADEASSCRFCISIASETKAFDVGMCRCTVFARVALDFTDLYHCDGMRGGRGFGETFVDVTGFLEVSFATAGTEMWL